MNILAFLMLACAAGGAREAIAAEDDAPNEQSVDFGRHILPILAQHCFDCHGPQTQEGDLRLDRYSEQLTTGERPLIRPGESEESRLFQLVAGGDADLKMPPQGPGLSDEQLAWLKKWIEAGAPWPREGSVSAAARAHWAFRPVERPGFPQVQGDAGWARNPIDLFILAHLQQEHADLSPTPPADRPTLTRRLYLDLLGLPPTPEEIDAFVADNRPDAYERLVDQLLASPHFGERWGRHWLDVARYAETDGFAYDPVRPHAWVWRDWVIDAVNRDVPYDEFTIEQLAGDLLPNPSQSQLIATGLHRSGPENNEDGIDPPEERFKRLIDEVDTTAAIWLGVTAGCARCHDHPWDPISQTEYYQLLAMFSDAEDATCTVTHQEEARVQATLAESKRRREKRTAELRESFPAWKEKALGQVEANQRRTAGWIGWLRTPQWLQWSLLGCLIVGTVAALSRQRARKLGMITGLAAGAWIVFLVMGHLSATESPQASAHRGLDFDTYASADDELTSLNTKIARAEGELKLRPAARVLQASESPTPTHVRIRGEYEKLGPIVLPSAPASWHKFQPRGQRADRLDLARWLVDRKNPLAARVAVNRVWGKLFGRGIVRTPADFGLRGAAPSHPALLDYLAFRFMRDGWSRKQLIRLIVTSATYRQTSRASDESLRVDPDNRLFARQNRFRLDAEAIHDSRLVVADTLVRELGGESFKPPLPESAKQITYRRFHPDLPPKYDTGGKVLRRAVYMHRRRSMPHPALEVFDAPAGTASCALRTHRNSPLQALAALNDAIVLRDSRALAARFQVDDDRGTDLAEMFRCCTGRAPDAFELAEISQLESDLRELYSSDVSAAREVVGEKQVPEEHLAKRAARIAVARALFNLDEFLCRE